MATEHIVKSFDQELDRLRNVIIQMGGLAESQLEEAIACVQRLDSERAARVVETDKRLDEYERSVETTALHLLALRQPVAQDLREIVSALKIVGDLERIGDYSANVAKRSIALTHSPLVEPITNSVIPRMGRLAQEIIKEVLDAYSERDLDKALDAWRRDEQLDGLYTDLFRETMTNMMEEPQNITSCTHLLFIAKNIERIGDHATNIVETIHFLIAGRPLRENRPKGDTSSYMVVDKPKAEPTSEGS